MRTIGSARPANDRAAADTGFRPRISFKGGISVILDGPLRTLDLAKTSLS